MARRAQGRLFVRQGFQRSSRHRLDPHLNVRGFQRSSRHRLDPRRINNAHSVAAPIERIKLRAIAQVAQLGSKNACCVRQLPDAGVARILSRCANRATICAQRPQQSSTERRLGNAMYGSGGNVFVLWLFREDAAVMHAAFARGAFVEIVDARLPSLVAR
jgi:hypothetical protein